MNPIRVIKSRSLEYRQRVLKAFMPKYLSFDPSQLKETFEEDKLIWDYSGMVAAIEVIPTAGIINVGNGSQRLYVYTTFVRTNTIQANALYNKIAHVLSLLVGSDYDVSLQSAGKQLRAGAICLNPHIPTIRPIDVSTVMEAYMKK